MKNEKQNPENDKEREKHFAVAMRNSDKPGDFCEDNYTK
jgi:hypothetical protein